MKTSFTPGPWSYGGLIGKSPGAIVANGGGVQVATAKVVPLMYGQQITSEEANANARLISAAPDLLEALTELEAAIDIVLQVRKNPESAAKGLETLSDSKWIAAAKASIAKATGTA